MSKFLQAAATIDDKDDAKAIAIPRVFIENSQAKNSSPKKGIILAKMNLELSLLFVYIPHFIVNMYFEFQVNIMFTNGRDMTKCHSICMTTTMTTSRL